MAAAAAIKVKINWNELRAYYSSGINEVFKGAFQLPLHEKDLLLDAILVAAVLLCNNAESAVAFNPNSYHDQIRMKLKNELRNAVGCCLRLETTNAIQVTDSSESKIDSNSLDVGVSIQPIQSAAPTALQTSSPISASSSSCPLLPSDGKDVALKNADSDCSLSVDAKKSLFMNADRRTVHAEVNFLQFHKSQDIFIPFGEICRRSSDYIACLKSSNTLAEDNTLLRNLLTSIESELSDAVIHMRKVFIDEVELCVSNHAVFLIDMVSAFVSSFKDGRALDNLRKRNIDGGARHDNGNSMAAISRESSVQIQPMESAMRLDSNQCATSSEFTSYLPNPGISSSTIGNESLNIKVATGTASTEYNNDFVANDGESCSMVNNDYAGFNPHVAHHFDAAVDNELPSSFVDAAAVIGHGQRRLTGSEVEYKNSAELSPLLNWLPAESLSHDPRNENNSTNTIMKSASRAAAGFEKAPASSDEPAIRSLASLNHQTRKKAKTAANDSIVLQGQAKESSVDTSRSTRNSRTLQTYPHPQANTRVPAETSRAAQTSRNSAASATSRRRDEPIRTARTRTRPRTNKIAKAYSCERFSRRGIVSSMELAAADDADDDMDDDVDICLLPSGLQTVPDPDLSRTNTEEPLCLQLWIQSFLQKGSWCKPGKVVGVYVDGVGPPSISSILIGVVVDNYLSDLAEDRDRHSTLLICLRGEVPVVLDSPTEVASFYFASKDDVVCIDDQGRVRLLSSVNRGNISEPRSVTPNSNDETGMLFINDISIDDNSEYGNSGTDSSSVRPTQSSSCRPLGTAFRRGTQFNVFSEPVAFAIQSVVAEGETISSSVTVKFQKWLENESALQDTDEWQTVKITSQNFLGEEESYADNEWMNIAVIKGIRVILMEHLNLFYLYQNMILVGEQIEKYSSILESQKELHQKQYEKIEQQKEILQQLNGLMEKLDAVNDMDEYIHD
eukprot:gene26731-35412_t